MAETLVTCSEADDSTGTIIARGLNTVVRNLQVSGQGKGVWVATSLTSIHLEDVLISQTAEGGLSAVLGGSASGRSLVNGRGRSGH